MVEAVADDELVVDLETDVLDRHVDLAAAGFAQQARGLEALGVACAKNFEQVRERLSGVNNVFDDDDVTALERDVEVLQQADLPRALGCRAVT